MNLCIDIGNSSSKVALFDKSNLVFFKRYQRLSFASLQKLITTYNVKKGIISSTRIENKALLKKLKRKIKLIVLDHKVKLPFKNTYSTPKTLGRDRIAAIAGALKLFPKKASFVADLGTCNTYDFVDAKKKYLGGNIAPGMRMRLNAMKHFTDKLPLVQPYLNEHLLGLTTEEALQNGAIKGIILEIDGYQRTLKRKYGPINVILTGGDASFFAKHFKKKIFAEPNLVLIGLNEILTHNIN